MLRDVFFYSRCYVFILFTPGIALKKCILPFSYDGI